MSGDLAARDGRASLLRAFKASGCSKCGVRYPDRDWSELHIDHIDPRSNGKWNGRMNRMSTGEAIAELLKCQVLCGKCHRLKHSQPPDLLDTQLALFQGNGSWHYR